MITISYKDQNFSFKEEGNISDNMKIEIEASTFAGGHVPLADIKASVAEASQRLRQHNENKFGKEHAKIKYDRMAELSREDNFGDEYTALSNELYNNEVFSSYIEVKKLKEDIYAFAKLVVLCTEKPDGFDFRQQSPDVIKDILALMEEQKVFFRK